MGFYLNDDLDELKKIAAEQALALMTGEIKSRVDRVRIILLKIILEIEKLKTKTF